MVPTPTTAGQQSLVKVQVRVDEQQRLQFSRIADLAGVSPPMSEERARAAEATSRQSRLNEVDGATRKRIKRTDSVAAERQKEQGMGPVAREYQSLEVYLLLFTTLVNDLYHHSLFNLFYSCTHFLNSCRTVLSFFYFLLIFSVRFLMLQSYLIHFCCLA